MNDSPYPLLPVLLIDDEKSWLHSFTITLRSADINNVLTCQDSRKAMDALSAQPVGTVVLDLTMPHVSGHELLEQITQEHPEIPVIIVTGVNDLDTAVTCMKHGAFDYFVKTVENDRLVSGICRAVELRQLRQERDLLKQRFFSGHLEHPEAFDEIVTHSNAMRNIFQYLETIAPSSEPALITGETGVGKELFARALHNISQRTGEFVAVNAAGLDDHVFSDTLFGHKKSAFTGADSTRSGLIERAEGGTLFLDELGDLPLTSQIKLLRLIQEREYYPLGSDVSKKTTARVVVATNRDLTAMTKSGEFRKDLYYRLSTHHMNIPPLRHRKEDLSFLLDHFLEEVAAELGKDRPTVPRELHTLLKTYHFPGNVREFRSMVVEALTHHKSGILSMELFEKHMHAFASLPDLDLSGVGELSPLKFTDTLPTLKEAADLLVDEALRRAEGNQRMAAEMLGMSRQALNKRLKQASSDSNDDESS